MAVRDKRRTWLRRYGLKPSSFVTFSCAIPGNHLISLQLSCYICKINRKYSSWILWAQDKVTYTEVSGSDFALGSFSRRKYKKNAQSVRTSSCVPHPLSSVQSHSSSGQIPSVPVPFVWERTDSSGSKAIVSLPWWLFRQLVPAASFSYLLDAPRPELPSVMVQVIAPRTCCSAGLALMFDCKSFTRCLRLTYPPPLVPVLCHREARRKNLLMLEVGDSSKEKLCFSFM